MSKRKEIVELLENSTDIEEICTDLGVSTSYVYRIKREIDESTGNKEEDTNAKENSSDGVVIDSPGGDSPDVEGNHKVVEDEKNEGNTNKTDPVGGVKKRKRTVKKEKNVQKTVEKETKGVIKWIKTKWKQMLLILSVLILSLMMILSLYLRKSPETTQSTQTPPSRFPVIQH